VDILVLLVERSSINGDGANQDIWVVGRRGTRFSNEFSLSESPKTEGGWGQ
jgi:hypothetical protein